MVDGAVLLYTRGHACYIQYILVVCIYTYTYISPNRASIASNADFLISAIKAQRI